MSRYLSKRSHNIHSVIWKDCLNGHDEYAMNLISYCLNQKAEFINARTYRAKDNRRNTKWEKMIEDAIHELNLD